ncbi:MAG: hypothetical protein ACK5O7_03465 [Holosporales bacterium]
MEKITVFDDGAVLESGTQKHFLAKASELSAPFVQVKGFVILSYGGDEVLVEISPAPKLPWLDRQLYLATQRRLARDDEAWRYRVDLLHLKGEFWLRRIGYPRKKLDPWEEAVLRRSGVYGAVVSFAAHDHTWRDPLGGSARLVRHSPDRAGLYIDGRLVWWGEIGDTLDTKASVQHLQRLFPQWLAGALTIENEPPVRVAPKQSLFMRLSLRMLQVPQAIMGSILLILMGGLANQALQLKAVYGETRLQTAELAQLQLRQAQSLEAQNALDTGQMSTLMRRVAMARHYAHWQHHLPQLLEAHFQGISAGIAVDPHPRLWMEGVIVKGDAQTFLSTVQQEFATYRVSLRTNSSHDVDAGYLEIEGIEHETQ